MANVTRILSQIESGDPFDADGYGPTWWTSMTDCTNRAWYFAWPQNRNTIWVELKNLSFYEDHRVRVLNPRNPNLAGEVSRAFEAVK